MTTRLNDPALEDAALAFHQASERFTRLLLPTADAKTVRSGAVSAALTNYIAAVAGTTDRADLRCQPVVSEIVDYALMFVAEQCLFDCFKAKVDVEIGVAAVEDLLEDLCHRAIKRTVEGHMKLAKAREEGRDLVDEIVKSYAAPGPAQ